MALHFNKIEDQSGNYVVPYDFYSNPELVSTQYYLYGIVPSISYHFYILIMIRGTLHISPFPSSDQVIPAYASALMMRSCTEKIDWDLKYQESDLIVVEGKITNEVKPHEVNLSRPVYEMNGIPEPVSGAVVEINDGR